MDESFTGRPVVTAAAASMGDVLRGPLAAGGPVAQAEQVAPLARVAGHGTGVQGDGGAMAPWTHRPATDRWAIVQHHRSLEAK